jgi:hypothetical protein
MVGGNELNGSDGSIHYGSRIPDDRGGRVSQIRYGIEKADFGPLTFVTGQWLTRRLDGEG